MQTTSEGPQKKDKSLRRAGAIALSAMAGAVSLWVIRGFFGKPEWAAFGILMIPFLAYLASSFPSILRSYNRPAIGVAFVLYVVWFLPLSLTEMGVAVGLSAFALVWGFAAVSISDFGGSFLRAQPRRVSRVNLLGFAITIALTVTYLFILQEELRPWALVLVPLYGLAAMASAKLLAILRRKRSKTVTVAAISLLYSTILAVPVLQYLTTGRSLYAGYGDWLLSGLNLSAVGGPGYLFFLGTWTHIQNNQVMKLRRMSALSAKPGEAQTIAG